MNPIASFGYGFAALAFLLLFLSAASDRRSGQRNGPLLLSVFVSVLWSSLYCASALDNNSDLQAVFILELAFDGAWLFFLSQILQGAVSPPLLRAAHNGGLLVVAGLLLLGVSSYLFTTASGGGWANQTVLAIGSIATSLFALIGIEQIVRNARSTQTAAVNYLCLGLGIIFVYDLLLYSNAVLSAGVSAAGFSARGYVVAMSAPLFAIAVRRAPNAGAGLFISRQVVFYSATVFVAVVYLAIVGFLGYYTRNLGGDWGFAVQLVVSSAGLVFLGLFLFSDELRARFRVFIAKHFLQDRYDYREEWLRLIQTLTSPHEAPTLRKRCLKALVQIVGARRGLLWLLNDAETAYPCVAGWNRSAAVQELPLESPIIGFLQDTGWVIERQEFDHDPQRYRGLDLTELTAIDDAIQYIVPLLHDNELLGFASISGSSTPLPLNFEDHDLLKTAGNQISSYILQEQATEQLAESRQFEAFNKLTAYIMHDFKNLIAQQSMVVENARQHKDNPAFVDDAIETIRGSVIRMRRIIEHLNNTAGYHVERVEVGKLVMQAVSECANRNPAPRARVSDSRVWVLADRDKFYMALYHAIRNAQDATPADGEVSVEIDTGASDCSILIADTGEGMDEAFIRNRLFRPFDSTKGTASMGIGAYQIRETVRAFGGHMNVASTPGEGTQITLTLPLADTRSTLNSAPAARSRPPGE